MGEGQVAFWVDTHTQIERRRNMFKDFKQFVMRGNVVSLQNDNVIVLQSENVTPA